MKHSTAHMDLSRRNLLLITVSHVMDMDETHTRALFDLILIHEIDPRARKLLNRRLRHREWIDSFVVMTEAEKAAVKNWIRKAVAKWVCEHSRLAKRPEGANLVEIIEEAKAMQEGGFNE